MKFQSLLLGLIPIDLADIATAIVCFYLFFAGFCGRTFYRINKPHIRRAWVLWTATTLAALAWPFGMRAYYILAREDIKRLIDKWTRRQIEKKSLSRAFA